MSKRLSLKLLAGAGALASARGPRRWTGPLTPFLNGSALATAVLRLFGWRVVCQGLPARQGVVLVYPHTSNWDFPIGVLTKWSLGFPLKFWAKDSLFRLPVFGHWMRAIGGVNEQGQVRELLPRTDVNSSLIVQEHHVGAVD